MRLLDPAVADRTALEGFEILVDPAQVHLVPACDLLETIDAEFVEKRLELRPHAPYELEIVGALRRRPRQQQRLVLVRHGLVRDVSCHRLLRLAQINARVLRNGRRRLHRRRHRRDRDGQRVSGLLDGLGRAFSRRSETAQNFADQTSNEITDQQKEDDFESMTEAAGQRVGEGNGQRERYGAEHEPVYARLRLIARSARGEPGDRGAKQERGGHPADIMSDEKRHHMLPCRTMTSTRRLRLRSCAVTSGEAAGASHA